MKTLSVLKLQQKQVTHFSASWWKAFCFASTLCHCTIICGGNECQHLHTFNCAVFHLEKTCGQVCESAWGNVVYSDVTRGHSWKAKAAAKHWFMLLECGCVGAKDEGSSGGVWVEKKDSQKDMYQLRAAIKETGKGEKHTQRHTHTHIQSTWRLYLGSAVLWFLEERPSRRRREEEEGEGVGRKERWERKRERQTSPKLARWANTL